MLRPRVPYSRWVGNLRESNHLKTPRGLMLAIWSCAFYKFIGTPRAIFEAGGKLREPNLFQTFHHIFVLPPIMISIILVNIYSISMMGTELSICSLQSFGGGARKLFQQNISNGFDHRGSLLPKSQLSQQPKMDICQFGQTWKHSVQIRTQLKMLYEAFHENLEITTGFNKQKKGGSVGKDFVYHACGHEFESRLKWKLHNFPQLLWLWLVNWIFYREKP